MTSPLDTTTVAKVYAWFQSQGISGLTSFQLQGIQDAITAWGQELLWLTGRGDQNNDVPTVSPFNQLVAYPNDVQDGNGSNRLYLRNYPVVSVQSLIIDTRTIPPSTGITVAGYAIHSDGKSLVLRHGGGGAGSYFSYFYPSSGWGAGFQQGLQNIFIAYTAGFAARVVINELQTIPAVAPYIITAALAPWLSNTSVNFFVGGTLLTPVLVAPAAGQYYLAGGGQYQFAAADAGKQVLLAYSGAGTPADVSFMSTKVVALTYKQRQSLGIKSEAMAAGAGTVSYDWSIDDKDWRVINGYKRYARV